FVSFLDKSESSSFNIDMIERPISGARKRLAACGFAVSISEFGKKETNDETLSVC
ncbi:unnamed protein product, partial [Rotaria sp. Silwood1]